MQIELTAWEKEQGLVSCETMRRIVVLLRICGVLVLKDVLDSAIVERVQERQEKDVATFLKMQGKEGGFEETNAARRGNSR